MSEEDGREVETEARTTTGEEVEPEGGAGFNQLPPPPIIEEAIGADEAVAEAILTLRDESRIEMFSDLAPDEPPIFAGYLNTAKRYQLKWLSDEIYTELKLRVSTGRGGRGEMVSIGGGQQQQSVAQSFLNRVFRRGGNSARR